MRKTICLSMAALALVGATMTSCSRDNSVFEEEQQQGVKDSGIVTLKTTISMDGDETRALTENGVKTFAPGEQIAVIYTNSSDETVKAVSVALTEGDIADGNKSANFTVTLDNPKAGTIKYVYPAAMANDDGTMANISTQDGTLESLSKNLDYCFWSGDWDGTALPEGKKLDNQLAICKFTVRSISGNDVTSSLSSFSVSDGTNTYNVTPSSLSTIYLAMLPVNNAILTFTLIGTDIVEKKVNGKTLEAGKMYPITVSLIPGSNEISYIECSWDGLQLVKKTVVEKPQGCLNHIDESQDDRTLSGTWYVTGEHDIDDVVLYVEKGKTLNIVLCDGASLTTGNIMVNGEGTTLRIFAQERGTGKLHINDEIEAPSIGPGGQSADSGGVIEIHGGNLTQDDSDQNPAIGNYAVMLTHYDLKRIAIYGGTLNLKGDAAGIGGHFYPSVIPTIDIYGGDITARSLDNDAGIGGYSSDNLSISIYGGTVRAYGGSGGAGIGNREGAPRDGGGVYIFGGTVTARGGMGAAGIGGGDRNYVDVYIHGGTVNAYAGNDGAGIGGGEDGDSVYITIFGGVVRAYGGRNPDGSSSNGYGAGIGSGQDGSVNKIIIKGGDIEAYGGMDAAGIGTGEEYRIQGINSGTIEIHGGRVYAKGGGYGAGIGSGQDASVGTIRIYGGDVTAYGGEDAAGIGTGEEYERDGIISGTIEIYGGKVYAYGKGYGAGIGAGEDATFGVIGISGGYVEAHAGSDCGNWSGGIGAYHEEHEDGCHIGWAGWERIWIGACMRLWTYSPYNGYWENVHYTENWWDFVHQRPWVAFGECNHVDGAYDITNCPYCHSYTLQLK